MARMKQGLKPRRPKMSDSGARGNGHGEEDFSGGTPGLRFTSAPSPLPLRRGSFEKTPKTVSPQGWGGGSRQKMDVT